MGSSCSNSISQSQRWIPILIGPSGMAERKGHQMDMGSDIYVSVLLLPLSGPVTLGETLKDPRALFCTYKLRITMPGTPQGCFVGHKRGPSHESALRTLKRHASAGLMSYYSLPLTQLLSSNSMTCSPWPCWLPSPRLLHAKRFQPRKGCSYQLTREVKLSKATAPNLQWGAAVSAHRGVFF